MTRAEAITRAKGGDWHGSYGLIPGPGHSASDRSMSVKDNGLDDVLLHSFAGDDWRPVKDELRKAGALADAKPRKTSAPPITYFYRYADGREAFRMVRRSGKRFHSEHPDGRGGWLPGMGGLAALPYRLPELIAADPASPVYITEGEKDADNLVRHGFVTTTNPLGAGKWRAEFAEHLHDRECVILPDNDEPGRAHGADIASKLRTAGIDHVILKLPGLPDKGDVSDWLTAGGTAAELAALTAAAWAAAVPLATAAPTPTFTLIDPAIWEGQPVPPRVDTWADRIPFRQATGLYGAGATGKSLLLQQAATCSALGRALLGVPMRPAIAIYLTCEDDADELHRRQVAICAALDVPLSALAGRLHLVSLAGEIGNALALFDASGAMLTTPAWNRLLSTALATGAGFIGLDNAAHLFGGNENDRAHVAAFVGLLNRLAIVANAAVPFLAHPNKAGAEYSGSTAWENQVRSRLTLDYARNDAGEIADLDARTLTIGKANYSRRGQPLQFRWHDWAFVLAEDLPPDHRAEVAANVQAAGENAKFLECLAKATAEQRAVSASSTASNYAPRMFATMPSGKPYTAKGFEAALHRLLDLGTIRNGERVYQRANRSWVTGLARAPTLAPTPAPRPHQPCTKPHDDTERNGCTNLHALAPHYTTYKSGADLGSPPPDKNSQATGAPVPQ